MTVPEPQKLLDWVGHMINILVLTEKRRTWREGVLNKASKLWEKPCVWNFWSGENKNCSFSHNFCSLRSKNSNTVASPIILRLF